MAFTTVRQPAIGEALPAIFKTILSDNGLGGIAVWNADTTPLWLADPDTIDAITVAYPEGDFTLAGTYNGFLSSLQTASTLGYEFVAADLTELDTAVDALLLAPGVNQPTGYTLQNTGVTTFNPGSDGSSSPAEWPPGGTTNLTMHNPNTPEYTAWKCRYNSATGELTTTIINVSPGSDTVLETRAISLAELQQFYPAADGSADVVWYNVILSQQFEALDYTYNGSQSPGNLWNIFYSTGEEPNVQFAVVEGAGGGGGFPPGDGFAPEGDVFTPGAPFSPVGDIDGDGIGEGYPDAGELGIGNRTARDNTGFAVRLRYGKYTDVINTFGVFIQGELAKYTDAGTSGKRGYSLDVNKQRITNLGAGVDDFDVVTFAQVKAALGIT